MGKRGHGYGSEDHLRNYLDQQRDVFNGEIAAAVGLSAKSVLWLPYPASERGAEREFQGLEFLPPEESALHLAWRDFWPTLGRQQTWDAVGSADGEWLLVEAKANKPEFCSPPTMAMGIGREKIEHSLNEVKRDLGVHRFYTWTGSYYQYANRLAVLWFLRRHDVDARLVLIYFCGDKFPDGTPCPASPEEWKGMIEARRLTLGLPRQHKLFGVRVTHVPRRSIEGGEASSMGGGIYLIQDDEQLVEMREQSYDSEDLLQALLAKYPSLLAGDQMGVAPRRWLLVGREASLPSEEDGAGALVSRSPLP